MTVQLSSSTYSKLGLCLGRVSSRCCFSSEVCFPHHATHFHTLLDGSDNVSFQVEYASTEYQLPRLIKMWTHLERQAGGKSRGMGEKQIEVDRRLLRSRIAQLRNKLDEVCVSPCYQRVSCSVSACGLIVRLLMLAIHSAGQRG